MTVEIQQFKSHHLDGAIALFEQEEWRTYTSDRDRTGRALNAPGSTTLVALDGAAVVGIVQLQSDGAIQAHLSTMVVSQGHQRQGLGRRLLAEALTRGGGLRVDLISISDPFYESLASGRYSGFRITRTDLGLPAA